MAADMSAVVNQLQANNQQQAQMDNALLTQAVQTKEVLLTSLGKLGESLRETLDETSDSITGAVLKPKDDGKLASQEAESQNEQSRMFAGISDGIKGLGGKFSEFTKGFMGSLKDKAKAGLGGIMGSLKKLAIGGALLGIMAFLNSKYWEDTKKFLEEDVLPALITLYDNVIVPIGNFIKDTFIKQWENIKTLFDGIGESMDLFKEGDILGGITTLISSLGTFFIDTIDNLITGVYNLFADFFGLEKTDSVFGEVKRFVTDTYNSIVEFFTGIFDFTGDIVVGAWTSTKDFVQGIWDSITAFFTAGFSWTKDAVVSTWEGLQNFAGNAYDKVTGFFSTGFSWAKDKVTTAWSGLQTFATEAFDKIVNFFTESFSFVKESLQQFNVFQFIEGVVGDAIDSVKAIFSGDFSLENFTNLFGSLFDIVTYPVNLAVNTVKDIFKFGDPDTPFRLSDFFFGPDGVINKAIDKITSMFTMHDDSLLANLDLGDMAKNFIQGLLQAVLPPPDFLTITTPAIKNPITGNDLISAKTMNLNPIPDAMYKLAGINPKTGRTFDDEAAEAQAELQKALEEMYGPSATPGEALYSGEAGRGGNTYVTYTDASTSQSTTSNQQSTYVPVTNAANKTSNMDD